MFQLRNHQLKAVAAALSKPHGGTLTAVIPPGGGKTIMALAVLDALHKAGRIDAAMVFTPRLGLCAQFELDWKAVRSNFKPKAMPAIVHRENANIGDPKTPSYVTSYQSLCADPVVHARFAKRHTKRLAIVCDEAHYLGQELHGNGETTQAAKILAELGEYASIKIVMTGTPYRADDNPIIFAEYDATGHIQADVELSYGEGVVQGFLCPFDATLFDGKLSQTRRRQRNGQAYYSNEIVELRFTAQQLTKVALDPQFWQLAVTHGYEKVKELQEIWRTYCGIVGCANQEHAREVLAYLQHLGARCLLAVSDDSKAHENLRRFKQGGYDMLVTVGMAHVGYDYKPIAVAVVLNGVREFNWLDQFTMRAGRVVPDRPESEQTAWIYGMNDMAMRRYVNAKRTEMERAIKLAEEAGPEDGVSEWDAASYGPSLIYNGITLDSISGIGFEYSGYSEDLDDEEEDEPEQTITDKELREQLRRRRQGLVQQYAGMLYDSVNGETIRNANADLLARFGTPVNKCTVTDLEKQIDWLERKLTPTAKKREDEAKEDDGKSEWVQAGLF